MSETHRPRRVCRSIGAVLTGFLAVVILSIGTDMAPHVSAVFPPPGQPMVDALWLLATAYRTVYGVAGSYIAAWLAPDRPMHHALALGVLGLAVSIMGTVATWNGGPAYGPRWFSLALIAIAMPCAWAGGRLWIEGGWHLALRGAWARRNRHADAGRLQRDRGARAARPHRVVR